MVPALNGVQSNVGLNGDRRGLLWKPARACAVQKHPVSLSRRTKNGWVAYSNA
jgi:hypothetical protein